MIIPQENERDLKEVPTSIRQGLDIKPVRWIDEVFSLALVRLPEPLTVEGDRDNTPPEKGGVEDDSDQLRRH